MTLSLSFVKFESNERSLVIEIGRRWGTPISGGVRRGPDGGGGCRVVSKEVGNNQTTKCEAAMVHVEKKMFYVLNGI